MRVIGHVLRKIDNDQPMLQLITNSPAVAELVNDYNKLAIVAQAAEDEHLKMVTGDTYGQEFKHYLTHVPALDLHHLLDRYLSHFAHSDKGNATHERGQGDGQYEEQEAAAVFGPRETDEQKEDRQLHRWLVKCAVVCVIGTLFILMGAMVAIMTHNHTADNAVFKTIMETAAEVIKIIFSSK